MGQCVSDGLEDDDATEPAVKQIVRIKRDTKQGDQWVVAASQQEEGDLSITVSKGPTVPGSGGRFGLSRTMLIVARTPDRFLTSRATSSYEPWNGISMTQNTTLVTR